MNTSLEYFGSISAFGASTLAFAAMVTANIAFTGVHILEEWKGEITPLYRVFGAIVGFCIPRWLGIALFTVLLAITQWTVGLIAYAGGLPILGKVSLAFSVGALGAVLGARAGDSIVSHWSLSLAGFLPNPGLRSTVLYAVEAILILVMFRKGLGLSVTAAWTGFACGFVAFLGVLPLMALAGAVFKRARRPRWVRGGVIPDWALAPDCNK